MHIVIHRVLVVLTEKMVHQVSMEIRELRALREKREGEVILGLM